MHLFLKRWRLILNVGRIQRGRGRPYRGAYLLAPRAPIPGGRLSTGWQLRHEGVTSAVEGTVEGAWGRGKVCERGEMNVTLVTADKLARGLTLAGLLTELERSPDGPEEG
jgi:hypothetical protein